MNLSEVKDKPISELVEIASELGLEVLEDSRSKKLSLGFSNTKHRKAQIFMAAEFLRY